MPNYQEKTTGNITLGVAEEKSMLGRKFIIANVLFILLVLIYLLFFG
jgi:hypothetical protein